MTLFIIGLVVFLGIHSISIVAPAWRDAQIALRGEKAWKGLYAIVSLVGFVLMLYGYGIARAHPAVLYVPPPGLRHVALLVMLPVFPLLLATYLPGRIQGAAKHPMLLAVILWGAAHLLANGSVADVLLFGGFFVWGVIDRISVGRSGRAQPLKGRAPSTINDAIAVVGGLAIYAAFLAGAHRWFFGVSPLR